MAALLRRRVALLLIVALAALALPAAALADGRAVLADFNDGNGRIDRCYPRADFLEALRLARADERLYGVAIDVIQQAQQTNVAGADGSCEGESAGGGEGDDGDVGLGLWIGVVVAVGLVAAGAGVLARRSGDDGGDGAGRQEA